MKEWSPVHPLIELCSILVLLLLGADISSAADSSAEPDRAQVFRDFLVSPPYIKRLIYGTQGDRQTLIKEGKHGREVSHGHGFVFYDCALQPESFYFRNLSNSVQSED